MTVERVIIVENERKNKKIYVNQESPLTEGGDSGFFPVSKKTFFVHHKEYETLKHNLKNKYAGILFFHVKGMKKDRGIDNYDLKENPNSTYHKWVKKVYTSPRLLSWKKFQNKYKLKNISSPESIGIKPLKRK